jgi:hypothetical protein
LFKDVQFCENQFVAISWRQTLFTSDDGATWKESAPNLFFGSVNSMAAGAGTFILVGSQGIILQRADDALTILSQTMRQSSDGIKRFSVETPLAINFDIESTTDFVNWSVLRHITGSSGYLEIEDNEASVREARFYRLRR